MSAQRLARCIVIGAVTLASVSTLVAQTHPPHGQRTHPAEHRMNGMTEAEFVLMMIRHHQDGIEMARLEEQKGFSPDVKALAAKIRESQEREVEELKPVGKHSPGATGTSGHAEHEKQMEQQSRQMMTRLNAASGQALDRAFLEEMAKHHQQAISTTQTTNIQDLQLKQVTQQMVSGQRQELAELKRLQGVGSTTK